MNAKLFGEPQIRVPESAELIRILRMPRRTWTDEEAEDMAEKLTALLKTPHGTMRLRPLQAVALCEIGMFHGLAGPLRCGQGKCLAGDAEIFDLKTGTRRLLGELGKPRDVFDLSTQRPCRITELVSVTSKDGDGNLVPANAGASSSGRKDCVRITLADGSSLTASFDHPVFTARGWVPASELNSDDLVATARTIPDPEKWTDASDDEVMLAAYLLSDGSVSHAATSFTNASSIVLEEFCGVVDRLADATQNLSKCWKRSGITSITKPSGAYELKVAGLSWFRRKWDINGRSKEKRVPATFWGLSPSKLGLFLNRFWACDGWVHPSNVGVTLASEKMIDDLRFMLLRLGVYTRKRYRQATSKGKRFDAWVMTVVTTSIERFFEKVGVILSKEQACEKVLAHHRATTRNTNVDVVPIGYEQVQEICDELGLRSVGGDWRTRGPGQPRTEIHNFLNPTRWRAAKGKHFVSRTKFKVFCEKWNYRGKFAWLATSDICWVACVEVEPVGERDVYDLSVPGFGCFVANNIVVHNTLIGFLAPAVTFAERPLLVLPAKLVKKTKHDYQELSVHWKIPPFIRIMTYEWLGRAQASPLDDLDALEQYNPDLIVLDEAHKIRNKKAAVTRRFVRCFKKHPDVPCVVMSGTFMKRSLHDFAHTIRWTHDPHESPLPADHESLDKWADALDERQNQQKVAHPGALEMFCNDEEREIFQTDPHRAARLAFRRRFVETRGVVASYETPIDATLTVEGVEYEPGAAVDEAFALMRKDMETPDGWPIDDHLTVARHAFEFTLGFYQVWDPRPPHEWLEARKAWFRFVRETLAHSRTLDSTKQVALAHPEEETYLAWKRVENTFVPNTVPVWIDDAALEFCAAWGEREKSFIWVRHVEFGNELSRRTGWPYYRRKGLCKGVLIDNHPQGYPAIASIKANDEGRNLQAWSTSLITAPPANGIGWEQLLSRLHRDLQEADEVQFDVLIACVEHAKAVAQALSDAQTAQDLMGSPQKLLLAAVNVPAPETLVFRSGARWSKFAA